MGTKAGTTPEDDTLDTVIDIENSNPEEVSLEIGDDDETDGEDTSTIEDDGDDDEAGDEDTGTDADDTDEDADEEEDDGDGEVPPGMEADDADGEDAEFKSFPKTVQKRIKREIQIRKNAEAATAQAVAAAQLREQEAAALRKQHLSLQRGYAQVLQDGLETRIEMLTAKIKEARADSDVDKETELQGTLDSVRYKLQQVREVASGIPAEDEPDTKGGGAAPAPARNPQAEAWLARNKWISKPKYARQRMLAMSIDAELAAEGLDKTSAAYFKELDKRLRAEIAAGNKKPTVKAAAAKQPVTRPSGGGGAGVKAASKGNKVTITAEDKANMRRFGLDPTNKEHLISYAREKASAA